MNTTFADKLIATLPETRAGVFNPWTERCAKDSAFNGPAQRRMRLAHHLDCNAGYILIGEAIGYQGARYSGIAFTNERLLIEGAIPRVPSTQERLSERPRAFSEPSATIVWEALHRLGIADRTILWNSVQLHPFRGDCIWTNRTPTDAEVELGRPALELLISEFPAAKIIAVGGTAKKALSQMSLIEYSVVRHPANGGAPKFAQGLESIVKGTQHG